MAGGQLLRPDNRFLDTSIGDLSNYGAQPDSSVSIRPAPLDTPSEISPAAPTETALSQTPADAASFDTMPTPDRPADGGDGNTANATQATPFAPATVDAHHPLADTGPIVPSPVGSATSPAHLLAPEITTAAHPATLANPDGVSTISTSLADTVHDAVQPITTLADATSAFVVDSIGSTASTADAAADTIVNTLATSIGATTTADALGTAVGDLAPHSAAGNDVDLSGLGGTDPAAGVTTLVDMVTSDNLFDLRDAGAPETASETPSSIDQLIGESAETSPLLGDAAHHGDAADAGGSDMHHDLGI